MASVGTVAYLSVMEQRESNMTYGNFVINIAIFIEFYYPCEQFKARTRREEHVWKL